MDSLHQQSSMLVNAEVENSSCFKFLQADRLFSRARRRVPKRQRRRTVGAHDSAHVPGTIN